MNDHCNDPDCAYPECKCWQHKHSVHLPLERVWINQPATTQPLHHMHGVEGLYDPNDKRLYFTEGNTISMQMPDTLALSKGWPSHNKATPETFYDV